MERCQKPWKEGRHVEITIVVLHVFLVSNEGVNNLDTTAIGVTSQLGNLGVY